MAARSITPAGIARLLLDAARDQGFELAAVLPKPARPAADTAAPGSTWISPSSAARYLAWLEQQFHGEMTYLARPDAVAARLHPESLLPGLRSLLVVGMNYHACAPPDVVSEDPSLGLIAGYARGGDYHSVMRKKLAHVATAAEAYAGRAVAHNAYVDASPVLERDLAAQAGLGFLGKNTCLINPRLGSWFFLGEMFLTEDVAPDHLDAPPSAGTPEGQAPSCGRCTRCLKACPTGALVAPHTLDSRRCISYLTIELRGPIPRDLRPLVGNRIFGCDICQQVCPWNRRFGRNTAEPAFAPRPESTSPRLLDLLALDDNSFAVRFRGSPIGRAKRRGLLRNAAVALGNWGSPEAVPALATALHDTEPLVRGHAAWALGRIGTAGARSALASALSRETDAWAGQEIGMALEGR